MWDGGVVLGGLGWVCHCMYIDGCGGMGRKMRMEETVSIGIGFRNYRSVRV